MGENEDTRSSCKNKKRGECIMIKRHRMLSFLVCIVLAAAFMGCASTEKKRGTGEYIDDGAITTKVKAAILNEPTLKVFQINVETFKGDVQLSGFVDSAQSVSKAGEVARGVKGVKSVKNSLIVR
jgi:osmotically-inducible protein OsmY